MKWIVKLDGRRQKYKREKLEASVLNVFKEIDALDEYAIQKASTIADYIEKETENIDKVTAKELGDYVEKGLMNLKNKDIAKRYILYRDERTRLRGNTIDRTLKELVSGESEYWKNENSNKNADIVTVQRDYIAGIASTDAARRFLLPRDVCDAHDAGIIHFHDMDYALQMALHNCDLINLDDMLNNGTVINNVMIEPQKRLSTAVTVATQIITAVSSSQYGGASINLHDLAPFVKMSADDILDKYTKLDLNGKALLEASGKELKDVIRSAVQTFNYQINSMSTTNGQSPFLTVFIYLNGNEYTEETAMLAEEFFKQRIKGLKNRFGAPVTQAFPKLIYVLDENNIKEDSEYYWLTKLAAECTSKRMVPDYISAKVMKELKGDVYSVMGCRSALTPDRWSNKCGNISKAKNFEKNKGHVYSGRFNMGVVTLNLPDAALTAKTEGRDIFDVLEERCELCHKGLQVRIDRLSQVTSDCAPILWQDGALARLDQGEKLDSLIHNGYATASLGYVGLWEAVQAYTGHKLTSTVGKEFGLKIMQFLNDKCNQWKAEENIDYSLYGTPEESTTYKFAKALRDRFPKEWKKLGDTNYVTNSYHIHVTEKVDPFFKLEFESEFQKLSPGGAISYIESANLSNNIEALMTVIEFMYDNIMYSEINSKFDRCNVCGYEGEIEIIDHNNTLDWKCPQCGCMDHNKMNIARRVCGYISTNYFNQGRTAEIKDRYVHLDTHEVDE